jgi:toxin ParE1/3/4
MRKRMRLEWSAFAQSDRTAIFDYIEADSPKAAIAVDERIREQVETLAWFPGSGRPGRIEGTRELVIHRTPYIVAYRITGSTVRILRVLHSARRWPDMSEEVRE